MKKLFTLFFSLLVVACTDSGNSEPPTGVVFMVSSYVRGNFYNEGRITPLTLNACDDLVCLGVTVQSDGSLTYESFTNSTANGVTNVEQLFKAVESQLDFSDTKLRVGISGGDNWKSMVASSSSVQNFVTNVSSLLNSLDADGVDIDFEWAQTNEEYANYSAALVALRSAIGNNYLISASIHPISYKLSDDAVNAVDYMFLQCYGPTTTYFSYDAFVSAVESVLAYGIPRTKLFAGIPFYGVATDNSKSTLSYYSFVENNLITSSALNQVSYNGVSYTFNGQDLVSNKTSYCMNRAITGVMCWDLADDVYFGNELSLLGSVVETIN